MILAFLRPRRCLAVEILVYCAILLVFSYWLKRID
jgi:hypothetical protein